MSKRRIAYTAIALGLIVLMLAGTVSGKTNEPVSQEQQDKPGHYEKAKEISSGFSQVIGISVSPLFGMGVICAYGYYTTKESERGSLPWYNSPKFWAPILIFILLIVSKDFITTAFPILQPLKKPLDALENFENIISGIIAMPFVFSIMLRINEKYLTMIEPLNYGPVLSAGFMPETGWEIILLAIVGLLAFIVVWLACHSINVLIFLSPFGFIDLFLRSIKLALIISLALATYIHPFLGLFYCLILIYIAYRISGWSFRLTVFGTVFSLDILTRKSRKQTVNPDDIKAFSCKGLPKAPNRSFGRLKRSDESTLEFTYRPWLIMPRKTLLCSDISEKGEVCKGLINPSINEVVDADKQKCANLFKLPPRYKSHEEEVAKVFGIQNVKELTLSKGMQAMKNWIEENIKGGKTTTENT